MKTHHPSRRFILLLAVGFTCLHAGISAIGQGTLVIANNLGQTIYPILTPLSTWAKGPNYSVEVFVNTMDPANKIGSTLTIGANGRFAQSGSVNIPGASAGSIVDLVVRAWDIRSGATYETALVKGSTTFKSPRLGGEADGDPRTPPLLPRPMVTGNADGFQSFTLAGPGPPSLGTIVIANNVGANIYPVLRPSGTTATGSNYSVEVFVNDTNPLNKIGVTMTLTADGRFAQSGSQIVPGVLAGDVATLIARAWDNTTGATYDAAKIKGLSIFTSAALGGDVDGDPSTPPAPAPLMVNGTANGFQKIQLQGSVPAGIGTIVIANNKGATIYPVLRPDGSQATGGKYSVEIFVNDTGPGHKIGGTMILTAEGRFSQSGSEEVPGLPPGAIATLVARAWDNGTGATYDTAKIKGSSTFKSGALGGDVDGDPSTPPAPAPAMVTGRFDGFQAIQLQGSVVIGVGTVVIENKKGATIYPVLRPNGTTATGGNYSVEVFVNTTSPGNKIGGTMTLTADGRFSQEASQEVPGVNAGAIANLTVRAWDNTTGASYDSATIKGSTTFKSPALGGDVDGDESTPPEPAPLMVTGNPDGFQNVRLHDIVITGGGTIVIANNKGATIYPVLLPDGSQARGDIYSVEVFANNTDPANKIGSTMTLGTNGRFSLSGTQTVPGVAPGETATLIARAWDNRTGATYDAAFIKGSAIFKSGMLGGDVDGDPSTPPAQALGMVTGNADGFQNIQLGGIVAVSEPSTIALGALGVAALLLRRRK